MFEVVPGREFDAGAVREGLFQEMSGSPYLILDGRGGPRIPRDAADIRRTVAGWYDALRAYPRHILEGLEV